MHSDPILTLSRYGLYSGADEEEARGVSDVTIFYRF